MLLLIVIIKLRKKQNKTGKNMKKKIYITAALVLGGLVVGAAVEHIRMASKIADSSEEDPKIIHHVQKVARSTVTDSSEKDELIASLQKKIAGLETELKNLRVVKSQAENAEAEKPKEERKREGWKERMERMKKEEPEKYAEMQQRREEFKAKMEERKENKRDFLSAVDTTDMSDEQQVNHERLVALTERVNEIMEQMMSGEVENRRELRSEMHESFHELRELNDLERVYLLEQTASAVGYEGDEAALFTEHVESIIENTTMQMPGPPGGGHGRGGPR